MKEFATILEELLISKNISQKDFYSKMNYSKNQVHYWLKNKANPSLEQLKEISIFFGVSIDYLLGLENEDYTKNYTPSNTLELTEDITEIIEIYLTLNDRDKYLLRAYLNAMVISNEDHQ